MGVTVPASLINKLSKPIKELLNKPKKLKTTEKRTITRAAKKLGINMSVAELKKAYKSLGRTDAEKAAGAGKFKPDPNYKAPKPKDMGRTKGLTPKQKRERDSLVRQVEEEMAREQSHGAGTDKSRRRKTGPKGTPEKQKVQQGPLLSKVPPPEKVSKKRRRQLVQTGQAKMSTGKGGKSVVKPTGEFAPPASMIAEEMGLRGRGKLPTAKEAEDFGLTVKKYGGKIKRNMGGPVRGVGKATRGFGKATYSNKLY